MDEPVFFHDASGHRIAAILSKPSHQTDHIAVLCHGFLSHKNSTSNQALTARLIENGIAAFRFDCFGHGESDGPFAKLTTSLAKGQALAALRHVYDRGYRRLALVGSSFGGLMALHAAADWTTTHMSDPASLPPLACLALKCPVADFGEELRLELGEEGMQQWRQTDSIPDLHGGPARLPLDYAFYQDCLASIAYEPARKLTVPTLIVQGDHDECVPLHQSRRLFDALPGPKRLNIIPGADHRFTKPADFQQMLAFLTEWISRHPIA